MSNEELQKAIDDITNEGAASASSISPAAPAADDSATEDILPPAPAPEMPNAVMPENMMPTPQTAAEAMPATDAVAASAAEPIAAPAPAPEVAMPAPAVTADVTISADALIDNTAPKQTSNLPKTEPAANLTKVKQDALRELFPLMDKLNIDPVQKFGIYKDIIALTHEQSAIEEAHATVQTIADEQTRADALLELLEIIADHQ